MAASQRTTSSTANNCNKNNGPGWIASAYPSNMQTMLTYAPKLLIAPSSALNAPYNPTSNSNNNKQNTDNQQIPFCVFKNTKHCSIHGHHVKDNRISQTCTIPGPTHNPHTIKFNTLGDQTWEHTKQSCCYRIDAPKA